jgi:hypothetical protein
MPQATRVFVVYAEGDERYRDLLVEEAAKSRMAVELVCMPSKQPWVPHWKVTCRNRVLQCDGAIVAITRRTSRGEGVRTELDAVCEARLPVLGVFMEQPRAAAPEQVRDSTLLDWNWPEVAGFIRSLSRTSLTAGGAGSV